MNRVSTIENNTPTLSEAYEEELCLAHDIFLLKRPLTEEEEKVLFDPTKAQIPTLAQVRKRLKKYHSPFSKPPKVLTDITLTPPEAHEQSLSALNRVDELHSKAKEMADLAFIAGMEEQTEKIKLLYKQAFDYERKAAMLSVQTHESDIELTPQVLSESAASLALDAQAYDEAEEMIEFGLSCEPPIEMIEELLGLLDYLADVYYEKGEYNKAQPLFEKALAIGEEKFDEEPLDMPHALNNLGLVYQAQGKYDTAQPLFEKALAIREKTLDAEHPDVATSLNNLGYLYQKQGKYDKAQSLLEKALAIREKVLGNEHSEVAECLNNLGILHQEQAKRLFERALTVLNKTRGNAPSLAKTVHSNLENRHYRK